MGLQGHFRECMLSPSGILVSVCIYIGCVVRQALKIDEQPTKNIAHASYIGC